MDSVGLVDSVDIVVPHIPSRHVVDASLLVSVVLPPDSTGGVELVPSVPLVTASLEEDGPLASVGSVLGKSGPPVLEACDMLLTQDPARPPPENSA